MATGTENVHHITQFDDMIHVKSQQIKARFRPFLRILPMKGDKIAYDGIEDVEAREIVGRYQPVKFDSIKHTRRKIGRRRFAVTLPIDKHDVRARLTDPQGIYATAVTRAMERQFDHVCNDQLFADVQEGEEFGTTTTFVGGGGNTVNAIAGSTYETLLEVKEFFVNNEIGTQMDEVKLIAITGTEEIAFMQEIELISGDFTRTAVVDEGEIVKALGMRFITFGADVPNPILTVNSGTRDCAAMINRGLVVGMSKEFGITVAERHDLVETTQVQILGELGAVRTEDKLIQKFQTTA